MYVHNDDVTYFDSFVVEHIPKEIKALINNYLIKTNILCGYFCIGFIDWKSLGGKSLTEYTNLFSANNFKKNDDIILNYFMTDV